MMTPCAVRNLLGRESPPARLTDLPDEVLVRCADFLPYDDFIAAGQACRSLRAAFAASTCRNNRMAQAYRLGTLVEPSDVLRFLQDPDRRAVLSACRRLEMSRIKFDRMQDLTVLSVLAQRCPNLEELSLSGHHTTSFSAPSLQQFSNLTHLHLQACSSRGGSLAFVSGLTQLQSLRLGACMIDSDAQLEALYPLSNLVALSLKNNMFDRLPDGLFDNLTALQHLDLTFCDSVSEAIVPQLGRLPSLRWLSMYDIFWADNQTLKSLTRLTTLYYGEQPWKEATDPWPHVDY